MDKKTQSTCEKKRSLDCEKGIAIKLERANKLAEQTIVEMLKKDPFTREQ